MAIELVGEVLSVNILGDGTSSQLVFDLLKPPFRLSFGGRLPSRAEVSGGGATLVSLDGTLLTLSFTPFTGPTGFTLKLFYA